VQRYGRTVRAQAGIGSVLLPVGTGIEVSRFGLSLCELLGFVHTGNSR